MICIILSLFAGFAFWGLGILLFPVAPAILIAITILASQQTNQNKANKAQ